MIASIKAIDNHAHPVLPPPNDMTDRDYDALPVDNIEPQTGPVAWRPDNRQLRAAWKALWEFDRAAPLNPDEIRRLAAARAKVKAAKGVAYDDWVLDRAGISTMLANRVSMGRGMMPPRFRWVPYVDALLFPLDNTSLAGASPDKKLFFPLEGRVLSR